MIEGLDPALDELVDELTDRLLAGDPVDVEAYLRAHPGHAGALRRLVPALGLMVRLGDLPPAESSGGLLPVGPAAERVVLGDFRLLREVGRGGMGVVYEAEQVSLGRRVALKVLPFAAALDSRQMQRFRLEAQAAACLHHTNIVPVHAVGSERGVPYYAMQFIEGRSLAAVIGERRRLEGCEPAGAVDGAAQATTRAAGLGGGPLAPASDAEIVRAPPEPVHDVPPAPSGSSTRDRSYLRTAAHLARQAAEALDHAHQRGIVHRDVKPGNLLVDAEGRLWVTDFGLAQIKGNSDLTLSGDLLGTLRYMSPEQASGRRVALDGRTDVYSLGATLYELVTLHPAVAGADRPEVLHRIVHDEPLPPRRLNPAIPVDLETIVRKAMAKGPVERYATAQELADDLGRFLEGLPIRARRPSLGDRAAKWVRRRWPWAAAAALMTVVIAALVVAGLSWSNARLRGEVARADRHAREAVRLLEAARLHLARQALDLGQYERAQDVLDESRPGPDGTDLRGFAWHYLRRLARREDVRIGEHAKTIIAIALAPDGRSLAMMDTAGVIVLWDLETERPRLSFRGEAPLGGWSYETGWGTAFFPDGRLLVAMEAPDPERGHFGAVVVWDTATGRLRARIAPASGEILGGYRLLAGGLVGLHSYYSIRNERVNSYECWDLTTDPAAPRRCARVDGLKEFIIAPGDCLAALESNNRLTLHDARTGAARHTRSRPKGPYALGSFSTEGRMLTTCDASRIFLWDAHTGIEVARWEKPGDIIHPLLFSPDGQTLAAPDQDGNVHLWDRATGRRRTLSPVDSGRRKGVSFAFSPDGNRLAISYANPGGGGVNLRDVATGRLVESFPGRREAYGWPIFAPDGRSLFLRTKDQLLRWWPESSGDDSPTPAMGHTDEAWAVAFSPDGSVLASGSDDKGDDPTIKLWDAATCRFLRGWKAHVGTVAALAFSPDGRLLASASLDRQENVRVWDLATGRLRARLVGHTDRVRTVAFSPDGSVLATAGSDRSVRLWDVATAMGTPRPRAVLKDHSNTVRKVAFSPDGRMLASAGEDATIRLWDARTGQSTRVLRGPKQFAALAFFPEGAALAAADDDGVITVWDTATWAEPRRMRGDDSKLHCLAYAPDGLALAAAGQSHKITLWDPATGQELVTIPGPEAQVNALAFAPDGSTLVSADHGGAIRLWRGPPRDSKKIPAGRALFKPTITLLEDLRLLSTHFAAPLKNPTGPGTHAVAVGDFNLDGTPDLVGANRGATTVSILLGNGDGTFRPKADYGFGPSHPLAVTVADLNRDGRPDVITANYASRGTISVLLGNGDGTFRPASTYPVGWGPTGVVAGDFNGDGSPDLAVAFASRVAVLTNDGRGTFKSSKNYPAGERPYMPVTGDFNRDGKLDLATSDAKSSQLNVLLGNGNGTFQAAAGFAVPSTSKLLTAGDFDNDGRLDLAAATGNSSVSLLLGNGNGTFGPAINYSVPGAFAVAAADFNQDDRLDLAVTSLSGNTVTLLQGDGSGGFQDKGAFVAGTNSYGLGVGDFDRDGMPDLAVGNNVSGGNISVLLNRPGGPTASH